MFRSPSGFKVSLQALAAGLRALAAVLILMAAVLAAPSAQAQSRKAGHETNATRQARIARQIQETYTHRWEVAGGGGWLRFRSGEYTQKNSEIAFWLNTNYYLTRKLGITGELRGAYGNAKVPNYNQFATLVGNPQISEYPFLAGPTYRFFMHQKIALSAFALGGAAIGKFDGASHGIPASQLGFWPSTNAAPAVSLGGNLDMNVFPNLAFRIAPSYLGTGFGGSWQNNVGFEMGLVVRFGKQK
jgi:hypothetical protein